MHPQLSNALSTIKKSLTLTELHAFKVMFRLGPRFKF